MALITTDMLVGSVQDMLAQSFTGGAAVVLPAGDYYLRHTTSTLSLIDQLASVWTTALGSTVTVVVQQNLLVRIDIGGGGAAVTWGTATTLRDLLGFTGDLASSTSHVATRISPLLWCPRAPALLDTPQGVSGEPMDDTAVTSSNSGLTVVATRTSTATTQTFDWKIVLNDRVWTSSALGGEYATFMTYVLRLYSRFLYIQGGQEDSTSSTTMTWGTQFGPYKPNDPKQVNGWFKRVVANSDTWSPITLRAQIVSEYS